MEIDGCTRVTEILGWYQDLSKIPQDILERKCAIGTAVHDAIESHLKGDFYVSTDEMKGYMQSFLKWVVKSERAVGITEERFFDHELKITGQIDCMLESSDGKEMMENHSKLMIVDFKTSRTPNHKIWRLQGGFYHMLAAQQYRLGDNFMFLQLLPDGQVAKEHLYTWDRELKKTCLSVLETYRYFTQKVSK